MKEGFGYLLLGFGVTAVLFVPFIRLLFRLHFTRRRETEEKREGASKNFYEIRRMHAVKAGVPTGGGILVAVVVLALGFWLGPAIVSRPSFLPGYELGWELGVLLFTFGGFALLGFYDDLIKIFGFKKTGFFGLRMRHKLVVQWLLALMIGAMMHWGMGIDFVYVPFVGIIGLEWGYVLLAAFLIVAFANAFDITDGLDGLSCGLLAICLTAFWAISATNLDSILMMFIPLWIGAVLAFLYFNIYPARIMLGNMGGLAFGATLAVVGLLSGKIVAMLLIAGIFLVEGASSLLQLFSKKFMTRRIFPIAPLHHWLQLVGWEEPRIVARAWLAGVMLAVFGLWLAYL